MPFQPDHSANLPRTFATCGRCGRNGAYRSQPIPVSHQQSVTPIRCRYCKAAKAIPVEQFTTLAMEASLL